MGTLGATADIKQLKPNSAAVNLRLEHLGSSVAEVKEGLQPPGSKSYQEIKDLEMKVKSKTDALIAKVDQKTDKTDSRIDTGVYIFIAGLFLQSGFNIWMKGSKNMGKNATPGQK